METLKEALNIRKVECRVETPHTVYCGSPKDLLVAISENELQLANGRDYGNRVESSGFWVYHVEKAGTTASLISY
ncbi:MULTISPECIES: hypothetical protein [Enterococcus]|uniref:hypothetical protein n=1 Tax=Enterococcus TaxID=1350 RepID=UPI001330C533|nr:hypothetical protein [Enterococcus casseliflavus]WBY93760.1 hypothetical protein PEZ80_16175 [Enterococcus casseliflavus]